jgi:hypothetical protein
LDWVAEGDVAGDAFIEAVFAENTEGGSEAAFEVVAFGVFVCEGWWAGVEVLVGVVESGWSGGIW